MDKQNQAIAIVRIASTARRNGSESAQSQLAKIQEFATKNCLEIVEIFRSADNSSNQTLKAALDYCKSKPKVKRLVLTGPDRLARSIDEYYWWRLVFERANVKVYFSDKDAPADPSNLLEAAAIAMARQANEMRSLRAKRAWQQRKKAAKA